mmetsp:Transcript_56057/g.131193  ORF Transcript_56057/g.131193 Transcript_56057/m.131193 type:complete len:278 (+) Transcript_56057:1260-2093(+)
MFIASAWDWFQAATAPEPATLLTITPPFSQPEGNTSMPKRMLACLLRMTSNVIPLPMLKDCLMPSSKGQPAESAPPIGDPQPPRPLTLGPGPGRRACCPVAHDPKGRTPPDIPCIEFRGITRFVAAGSMPWRPAQAKDCICQASGSWGALTLFSAAALGRCTVTTRSFPTRTSSAKADTSPVTPFTRTMKSPGRIWRGSTLCLFQASTCPPSCTRSTTKPPPCSDVNNTISIPRRCPGAALHSSASKVRIGSMPIDCNSRLPNPGTKTHPQRTRIQI